MSKVLRKVIRLETDNRYRWVPIMAGRSPWKWLVVQWPPHETHVNSNYIFGYSPLFPLCRCSHKNTRSGPPLRLCRSSAMDGECWCGLKTFLITISFYSRMLFHLNECIYIIWSDYVGFQIESTLKFSLEKTSRPFTCRQPKNNLISRKGDGFLLFVSKYIIDIKNM